MGQILRLHAVDLDQFRSMLGSGEERFCARVLRSIPPPAQERGLVKEWKRAVTGLVLGAEGEQRSSRSAFERGNLTKADPALSLAFASLVQGFAPEAPRAEVPVGSEVPPDLIARPLFGLEPDGVLVCWGGLSGDEAKSLPAYRWSAPVARQGLGILSLWGAAYADGEPDV